MDSSAHIYPDKPNDLEAFWMPFTANRGYKQKPRLLSGARGMHYTTPDGRAVLDGTAGLWCCNAGHGHEKIVAAIKMQAERMDFAPTFQLGHPAAFEFANRLVDLAPGDLDHVFFTNSGSESADTALKIALGYHYVRGKGSKTRLIGRERGYHGTNFGGTSVGGIVKNRMFYGGLLAGTDHIRHTHDIEHQAFSRGQPEWGAHLADDLERLAALHDPSTIAAVIVEPVAGSTGVLVPPRGYLRRLREICDRHDILLIFDEVITGFGRLGASFAADYFDVQPDILTTAKALTNATVPMGAVLCRKKIYDAFLEGTAQGIELFHGYTYSGHPLASAAGIATLDVLPRGRAVRACGRARALLGGCAQVAQGRPPRDRSAQPRHRRRHRAGIPPRRADRARHRDVSKVLRRGRAHQGDGRHHRALAAAHRREEPDRPHLRHHRERAEDGGLSAAPEHAARERRDGRSQGLYRRHPRYQGRGAVLHPRPGWRRATWRVAWWMRGPAADRRRPART